jgi:amidase
MADAATADAKVADAELRADQYGVPIAVQDLFWMAGVPSAAGTTIHKSLRPPEDATVVRRLRDASAWYR